jgi:hypothetical protein
MAKLSSEWLRRSGPLGRALRAQIPALVVLGPPVDRQKRPRDLGECSEQIAVVACGPLEYGEAIR